MQDRPSNDILFIVHSNTTHFGYRCKEQIGTGRRNGITLKAKIYSGVTCDSPLRSNNPTKRLTEMPEIV